MAELVASLLSKVVDLGVGEAQTHVSEVASVEGELSKLESKLKAIQPIFEDAHNKQFTSRRIKDWICRVNHIIYDAEDIIDLYKAKAREVDAQTGLEKVRKQLPCLLFTCQNFSFLHKTAGEIKEVSERLDFVYKEKDHYGLSTAPGPTQNLKGLSSDENRLTTSIITEQNIFGRQKDEELVVEWLKKIHPNNKAEQSTCVVAIVGMGGVGKTTLAKNIYNNSNIKNHFEKFIWICASDMPQVREFSKQILEGLVGKGSGVNEITSLNALNIEIIKHLMGKTFLLVVDDVWNCGWWKELNGVLQQGASGSSLITTRKEEVAKNIDATYLHRLKCLSHDESWCLFVNKVLMRDENEEKLDRVKDIGRDVVERCKGLPLALSVVGSMLKRKPRSRSDWQKVADNLFWQWEGTIVDHDENRQILSTIALSYMDLPYPLKQCLTCCSLYPKGYQMREKELALLWVAEGFIPEVQGRKMETCACDCLDALVDCSLIQQYESEIGNEKKYYTLHDIVHDLVSYVRGNENADPSVRTRAVSQARALCLTNYDESLTDGITQHTKLRTLMTSSNVFKGCLPACMLLKLKWLRVLNLCHNVDLVELPDCLGDLVLLKHLNVSHTGIRALPESIWRLRCLETLNLSATLIRMLPKLTSKLRALRHLHLAACHSLECMPRKIGKLAILQTLDYFVVGSGTSKRNAGCSIRELHHMNNIEGSLCIDHIERVQTKEEAKSVELHKKAKLYELRLHCQFPHEHHKKTPQEMEGIFGELEPPKGLKELKVFSYGGTKFPTWIGSLRCLERVSINNCHLLKELSMLAHLPNLEALDITTMKSLEEWSFNAQKDPLPSLRSLKIANCMNLRALSVGFAKLESLDVRNMETLEELLQAELMPEVQTLCFENCPKLRAIPIGFPKLRQLRINSMTSLEEWTQIETMPCLQSLEIADCPNLRAIPEGLRLAETYELELRDVPELGPTTLATFKKSRELESGGLPKSDLQEYGFQQTPLKCLDLESFANLAMESQVVEETIENIYESTGWLVPKKLLKTSGCGSKRIIKSSPTSVPDITEVVE